MTSYYRRVIQIRAEASPNVRRALAMKAAGIVPDGRVVVPGVLTWDQYQHRLATWDKVRICIGISAEFPEDAGVLLFPPDWLDRAERIAAELSLSPKKRIGKAIGIDPAEGGDKTAMACVDEFGLIELVSKKTPNTAIIPTEALAFMRKHSVPPERTVFDRGGGGKQHADTLRAMGYAVRTVAFGEALVLDPKRGIQKIETRLDNREERYAYVNRRAEMYGELSQLLDESLNAAGFGIPREYPDLRFQLAVFRKLYDAEGRQYLPPKSKKDPTSKVQTLTELIGHSPDEADALVLAIHGMLHKAPKSNAGGF